MADKYTDNELIKIEDDMRVLADIMIDHYLSLSKEERKELAKKIELEQKQKKNITNN